MDYRRALIVGVGSGLSASLARLFAKSGMKVAVAARQLENLAALAQEVGRKAFTCDATDREQVAKLFADVEAAGGAPDVVVYNASYRTRGPFIDLDPVEADRALAVTAYGGFSGGARRQGQVRAGRAGAKHGAGTAAARHPRRPYRRRRRHLEPAPAQSAWQ